MTKRLPLPSAHDVARVAGVSQAAVSRAFTPGASISEQTRAKVLTAAKELGYRPNLLARSLITGKSGIVGVVIGNPRNPFFLEALDYLSDRLAKAGLHLLVFTARVDQKADDLIESLLSFRVDALLLMATTVSPEIAEQVRKEGVPVILFNRRSSDGGFASVTTANYHAGGVVAEHLISQGYERLAYIGGFPDSSTSQERGQGFADKIAAAGLPAPMVDFGNYDRDGAAAAARRLLAADPRPDAIFCANDMMGLATIEIARGEFGLAVGSDLGVAGFDDIEGARWTSFSLTTYAQPTEAMIEQAVAVILRPANFGSSPQIIVPGELKVRDSTQRS